MISQHRFRSWIGAIRQLVITQANDYTDVFRHKASLGHTVCVLLISLLPTTVACFTNKHKSILNLLSFSGGLAKIDLAKFNSYHENRPPIVFGQEFLNKST